MYKCINTVHITNSNSFSEFRSMNLFRKKIIFLLVTELFARDHKYAWYSTGLFANLTDNVHLLLKEGLKIGYSPPTQYSRKWTTDILLALTDEHCSLVIIILVPNRLTNYGDYFLDMIINEDSITWGRKELDQETCLVFRQNGFFKRPNQSSVLPHAIGCQSPSTLSQYKQVLRGNQWIIE